jgi:hypothetical protein
MSKVDEILDSYTMYTLRGGYWADKDEVKKNTTQAKLALYKDLLELKEVSGMSLVSDGVWQKDYCIPVDKLKDYFGETND